MTVDKEINTTNSITFNFNGEWNYARTKYHTPKESTERSRNAYEAFFLSYFLNLRHVDIKINVGGSYEYIANNGISDKYLLPYAATRISYSPNSKHKISFTGNIANYSVPSAWLSSEIFRSDEFMYSSGNSGLKSFYTTNYTLDWVWLPRNEFSLSTGTRLNIVLNRIIRNSSPYNERKAILQSYVNDGNFVHNIIYANATGRFLNNSLSLRVSPQLNIYNSTGIFSKTICSFQASVILNYYFSNFSVSGFYSTPSTKMQYDSMMQSKSKSNYYVSGSWQKNNFNISLYFQNFLRYNYKGGVEELKTPVYSMNSQTYSGTNYSGFTIALSYTFQYGKKTNRGNEQDTPSINFKSPIGF